MIYVKVNQAIASRCRAALALMLFAGSFLGLVGAPSPGQAEPFRHRFGELREYHKHWLAVCPDKHIPTSKSEYATTCWASTYRGKVGIFLIDQLSVSRNRQTGAYGITFVTDAYERREREPPVSLRFSDGTKMQFSFGNQVVNTRSSNKFALAESEVDTVLAAMKRTNGMWLFLPTIRGEEAVRYSMIGVTAALTFTRKYANATR